MGNRILQSHPEEEENRLVQQEESEFDSEEEDEEEDLEDPSGLTAMSQLHVSAPDHQNTQEALIERIQRRQEEERKYMEMTQKEALLRDDPGYMSSPPGGNHHPRNGSKSTTPSPSSPPPQQYLYAAHPFASMFNPTLNPQMAAAAQAVAAAAMASAAHHMPQQSSHHLSGGSSTGSATPPNNGISLSSPRGGSDQDQSKYTFEEQFKQVLAGVSRQSQQNSDDRLFSPDDASHKKLYEISDDPGRKEFLDDLFNYMQKRGTPVNRIPIMAKQVLDLYELYRLVVARGGLVEVINKKIWREITKGLNLPSSITSAAFTLRTQYMKYLYAYECDKEKLSTQDELQAAIDGNRREGRRAGYSPYGELVPGPPRNSHHQPLPSHTSPMSLVSRHMNGHGPNPGLTSNRGTSSPLPLSYYTPPPQHNSTSQMPLNLAPPQENGIYNSNHALSSGIQTPIKELAAMIKRDEENCNSVPSTPNPMAMPQQEALNLETRNSDRRDHKPLNMASRKPHLNDETPHPKRLKMEDDRLPPKSLNMPSTNIRITSSSHPDGRSLEDGSLMVSMEVNGTLYQGVLYAHKFSNKRH
nr:protein dead ringer homolog [Parasteatoda tepidariorum]